MFSKPQSTYRLPRHSMAPPLATAMLRGRENDGPRATSAFLCAAAVQTAGAAGRETMGEAMDPWRVAQDICIFFICSMFLPMVMGYLP